MRYSLEFCCAMLAISGWVAFCDDVRLEPAIAVDPVVQDRLDAVIDIMIGAQEPLSEQLRAAGTLADLAKDDEAFCAQLFYYYVQDAGSEETAERRRLAVIRLIGLLDVSRTAIAKTVIPYLDSEDSFLRRVVRSFLELSEGPCSRAGSRDYSRYRPFLTADLKNPPRALIRYMYEEGPGEALLTMASVHVPSSSDDYRQLLATEHLVSDVLWRQRNGVAWHETAQSRVLADLTALSIDSAWWVRLYVAETMRQHVELRAADVVQRLSKDPHPLVRETAAAVQEEISRRPSTDRGAVEQPGPL